jgi:hypothetical protein
LPLVQAPSDDILNKSPFVVHQDDLSIVLSGHEVLQAFEWLDVTPFPHKSRYNPGTARIVAIDEGNIVSFHAA